MSRKPSPRGPFDKKRAALFACLWLGSGFSAALACEHPTLVEIPEAATISWNKYETLVPAIQDYLRSMEAYLACIQTEIDAAGPGARFEALLVERNNSAVTEMNKVVELYRALNEELGRLQQEAAEDAAPP